MTRSTTFTTEPTEAGRAEGITRVTALTREGRQFVFCDFEPGLTTRKMKAAGKREMMRQVAEGRLDAKVGRD